MIYTSRFFENEPKEICNRSSEKGPKVVSGFLRLISSKITLAKKGKEKKKEREERKEEKRKKAMVVLLVFLLATLEKIFGRMKLFD